MSRTHSKAATACKHSTAQHSVAAHPSRLWRSARPAGCAAAWGRPGKAPEPRPKSGEWARRSRGRRPRSPRTGQAGPCAAMPGVAMRQGGRNGTSSEQSRVIPRSAGLRAAAAGQPGRRPHLNRLARMPPTTSSCCSCSAAGLKSKAAKEAAMVLRRSARGSGGGGDLGLERGGRASRGQHARKQASKPSCGNTRGQSCTPEDDVVEHFGGVGLQPCVARELTQRA